MAVAALHFGFHQAQQGGVQAVDTIPLVLQKVHNLFVHQAGYRVELFKVPNAEDAAEQVYRQAMLHNKLFYRCRTDCAVVFAKVLVQLLYRAGKRRITLGQFLQLAVQFAGQAGDSLGKSVQRPLKILLVFVLVGVKLQQTAAQLFFALQAAGKDFLVILVQNKLARIRIFENLYPVSCFLITSRKRLSPWSLASQ